MRGEEMNNLNSLRAWKSVCVCEDRRERAVGGGETMGNIGREVDSYTVCGHPQLLESPSSIRACDSSC